MSHDQLEADAEEGVLDDTAAHDRLRDAPEEPKVVPVHAELDVATGTVNVTGPSMLQPSGQVVVTVVIGMTGSVVPVHNVVVRVAVLVVKPVGQISMYEVVMTVV